MRAVAPSFGVLSPLPPPTPYNRTSRRPAWSALPKGFRDALSSRLGAPVVSARVSGTGFTAGFAALVTTADGASCFVKAAELSEPAAGWYRREAQITTNLPPVRSPRLRWSEELAGFFVLCSDPIEGARVPSLPWRPDELSSALDALAVSSQALTTPPAALLALDLEPWSAILDSILDKWRTSPPDHPLAAKYAVLEKQFDELTRGSAGLLHCDLRLDNVIIDDRGAAWICDWSALCHGPAWFDLVSLLLSAEASGIDPDPLFRSHPLACDLPPFALPSALAALLGYYLDAGAKPDIPSSPNIRSHQRYYASLTSRWLARSLLTLS